MGRSYKGVNNNLQAIRTPETKHYQQLVSDVAYSLSHPSGLVSVPQFQKIEREKKSYSQRVINLNK